MNQDEYQMPTHVQDAVTVHNQAAQARVIAERDEAMAALRALALFITSAAPGTTGFTMEREDEGMDLTLAGLLPASEDEGVANYPSEYLVPESGPERVWGRFSEEWAADPHFFTSVMRSYRDAPDVWTFSIERVLDLTRSRLTS